MSKLTKLKINQSTLINIYALKYQKLKLKFLLIQLLLLSMVNLMALRLEMKRAKCRTFTLQQEFRNYLFF